MAKTSNILPLTDAQGFIFGTTDIVAGNHNDAFQRKAHLQTAFRAIKQLGVSLQGTYLNADSAFDTKDACKVCFNHGLIPNIAENKRNRKKLNSADGGSFVKTYTPNVSPPNAALLGSINSSA